MFLTGGDGTGWALDEDVRLTGKALEDVVELTDLARCEVVHSVWWEPLLAMNPVDLADKRILCHMAGEPFRYLGLPRHRHAVAVVDLWITQTGQATRQCSAVGLPYACVPYTTDIEAFYRLPEHDISLTDFRRQWNIPDGRYLIGSFHRDSAGFDLRVPKKVKGPDILAEIVTALHRRGCPVHLVLAGPRRHWIRRRI